MWVQEGVRIQWVIFVFDLTSFELGKLLKKGEWEDEVKKEVSTEYWANESKKKRCTFEENKEEKENYKEEN